MVHIPVLQKEVLEYFNPKSNENFIDATFGEGGHSLSILERNKPRGRVLGIEIDPELHQTLVRSNLTNRLILVNDSFVNLKEIVKKKNFKKVSGILFDLGLSSWHLEKSGRGFSFQKDEPLDMRYHITHFRRPSKMCYQLTAKEILNNWPEKELIKILKEYGQERFSKRIAKEIIETRKIGPIETTFQLVEIIKKAVPKWYQKRKLPRRNRFAILRGKHFATKTFQALRIAVNDELNNLKKALPQTLSILNPGGKIVVISFHSLEDRIVKNFFKKAVQKSWQQTKEGLFTPYFRRRRIVPGPILRILTKKPVRPPEKEIKLNPRSRSAKLRAAEKIANC